MVNGELITAYAVDASPALAVAHAVLELAPRHPDLLVSGVNFGVNLGTEVTVSGTVGAALEGGAFGIPSMALSLQMAHEFHLTGDENADYGTAAAFCGCFAAYLLDHPRWWDVDAWNINVPAEATVDTPWRVTRLSRWRYFVPIAPERQNGRGRPSYRVLADCSAAERDSDVWALLVDGVISVTPLSLDLTSRVPIADLKEALEAGLTDMAPEMADVASVA
jgi:5'-nucleotidase